MSTENPFNNTPSKLEREVSPDALRELLRDPSYLPTREEILRAFTGEEDSSEKWKDFCDDEENLVFEFLNKEFLGALGDYLSEHVRSLGASKESPITILEVGAGNGRLSHFLRQELEARLPGAVSVVATDSGKRGLKTAFPVEAISSKEAIAKHHPKIIICSWMPLGADFTADFRTDEGVDEYILIGETDAGCCGHANLTWGISCSPTPYAADGFERKDLPEVSRYQICRTDKPYSDYYGNSQTVSFKRKK